jgi:hypothetical protein
LLLGAVLCVFMTLFCCHCCFIAAGAAAFH